jgi:hypothetical protein
MKRTALLSLVLLSTVLFSTLAQAIPYEEISGLQRQYRGGVYNQIEIVVFPETSGVKLEDVGGFYSSGLRWSDWLENFEWCWTADPNWKAHQVNENFFLVNKDGVKLNWDVFYDMKFSALNPSMEFSMDFIYTNTKEGYSAGERADFHGGYFHDAIYSPRDFDRSPSSDPVPEPSTFVLLGMGICALAYRKMKKS